MYRNMNHTGITYISNDQSPNLNASGPIVFMGLPESILERWRNKENLKH